VRVVRCDELLHRVVGVRDERGCAPYEMCLGNCNGNPKCRAQCEIDDLGFTAPEVSALGACLASKCETACGLACGGFPALFGTPDTAATCQSCFANNACVPASACASSVDCVAYLSCAHACPTLDCRQACAGTHDAGAALFAPLLPVLVGTCSTPCAYGRNWSCVGNVSWPVAQSQTVAMTTFVATGPGVTPVSGAEVSVSEYCPPSAEAGVDILGHGQTNEAGTVEFPVLSQGNRNNGPGAGHGLDGCITVTSASFLQTLWYWGFPLTEPAVGWMFGTPTASVSGTYVPVISAADFMALNAAAGISTPDLTRGIVGVTIFDCDLFGAPDVQVKIGSNDPDIRLLYGTSFSATLNATDTSGEALFVNVSPGTLTLTATPNALGKPSSRVTVNVQANTFTEVLMLPTP
jgi:hypothetical protein